MEGKLSATSDATGHGPCVDADLDQDNMPYSMLSPKMRAIVPESEWRTTNRVNRRKCLDADADTDLDRDMPYTMLAALMRRFIPDPEWRSSPRVDRQKMLNAQAKLHKVVVEELLKVQSDRIVSFATLPLLLMLQEEGIIDEAEAQRQRQEIISLQERQHRAAQEKQLRQRLATESAENAKQVIETSLRESRLAHERSMATMMEGLTHKRCAQPGCTKHPVYGVRGRKKEFCFVHKKFGMVK